MVRIFKFQRSVVVEDSDSTSGDKTPPNSRLDQPSQASVNYTSSRVELSPSLHITTSEISKED